MYYLRKGDKFSIDPKTGEPKKYTNEDIKKFGVYFSQDGWTAVKIEKKQNRKDSSKPNKSQKSDTANKPAEVEDNTD